MHNTFLAKARALVETRRGPMPPALPMPHQSARPGQSYEERKATIEAWMWRDHERSRYEREVRRIAMQLRTGATLEQIAA